MFGDTKPTSLTSGDPVPGESIRNTSTTLKVWVTAVSATARMSYAPSERCLAAAVAPPSIQTLEGDKGLSERYALEDHSHPSSVQKVKIVTGSDGRATWTFKRPFDDTGYAVLALAETTDVVNVAIESKAKEQVVFKAMKARPLPSAITLVAQLVNYNVFNDPAANMTLHCFVGKVTQ